MSAQIWIVFLLTLGCTGLCQLPPPVNLNISSHNLVHLLTWDPPSGDPAGLQYRVRVYSLSDSACMPLPMCERVVTPLLCNLTEALSNLQESYFLHVWAFMGNQSSKPAITEEFIPMDHSYLDPPSVSVSVCGEEELCVALSPPSSQLMQVYSKLSYTLTIRNGKDGAEDKLRTEGLKGERLRDLEPGREYCVTARIRDRKSESHSSVPGCAHMPAAYSADVWISKVLTVFILVVVVALFLLYRTGFCRKASLDALVTVKSQPVSLLPTPYEKVSYSLVLIQSPAPPVARGQKCVYERNSGSEEDSGGEGEDDSGSSAGGYERRPLQDRRNSSSSCSPQAGRHYSVSKVLDCPPDPLPITDTLCGPAVDTPVDSGPPAESRSAPHPEPFAVCLTRNTPLTLTLTGDGSLPLSLTVKGPSLIRNEPFFMPVAENEPLSVFVTASRPLPVSVTAADPLSALGRTDGPLPQKPGVCVGEDRVGAHGEPAPELQGAGTGEWAEQCINLESVMLAGHGETEEEEGQRGGSMSQEPSLPGVTLEPCGLPPSQTSMLPEPPHMRTCSLQTSEEEEPCSGYMRRSNEEQEDEGEEEEPCSGYMRRSNEEQEDEGEEEESCSGYMRRSNEEQEDEGEEEEPCSGYMRRSNEEQEDDGEEEEPCSGYMRRSNEEQEDEGEEEEPCSGYMRRSNEEQEDEGEEEEPCSGYMRRSNEEQEDEGEEEEPCSGYMRRSNEEQEDDGEEEEPCSGYMRRSNEEQEDEGE